MRLESVFRPQNGQWWPICGDSGAEYQPQRSSRKTRTPATRQSGDFPRERLLDDRDLTQEHFPCVHPRRFEGVGELSPASILTKVNSTNSPCESEGVVWTEVSPIGSRLRPPRSRFYVFVNFTELTQRRVDKNRAARWREALSKGIDNECVGGKEYGDDQSLFVIGLGVAQDEVDSLPRLRMTEVQGAYGAQQLCTSGGKEAPFGRTGNLVFVCRHSRSLNDQAQRTDATSRRLA